MKYILVTGGVISGVGKGIIASSFGTILKSCDLNVTSIKIDPYLNIDAGTFSPYEHGEVYVLDDGGEVDLDLGNYERFLDATLHKENNITTGKIYSEVINKERKGEYLGKTVQVVPHITDEIQDWVTRISQRPVTDDGKTPDVCIVELGGTIGDIESMPFVEAFRQFQFRVKKENFCLVHVSLVPQPSATGEQKTKPTQSSVRELRSLGLSPDIIVCRSENPITHEVREKISNFCHVEPEQVIGIRDVSSIYEVPILMQTQGIVKLFNAKLNLDIMSRAESHDFMSRWRNLATRVERLRDEVHIALVGKYTRLEDSYKSVNRALQHASISLGFKLKLLFIEAADLQKDKKEENPDQYYDAWKKMVGCQGVIVPGGFGKRGIEGKIAACKWCRERNVPFLGICLGLQAAVIEFTRNVLKCDEVADSVEFKNVENTKCETEESRVDIDDKEYVIIDMPEFNPGDMGGTMRLGRRKSFFVKKHKDTSVAYKLYKNKDVIEERHRHRYEVNKRFVPEIESAGLNFVATDEEEKRMEILELKNHPYYIAAQFHPEYLSRPLSPSPLFLGLIAAASGTLKSFLSLGQKLPENLPSKSEEIL